MGHRLDSLARDHDFLVDTSLLYGLVKGLPADAPEYGIFPSQPATPLTLADVLEGWQERAV